MSASAAMLDNDLGTMSVLLHPRQSTRADQVAEDDRAVAECWSSRNVCVIAFSISQAALLVSSGPQFAVYISTAASRAFRISVRPPGSSGPPIQFRVSMIARSTIGSICAIACLRLAVGPLVALAANLVANLALQGFL